MILTLTHHKVKNIRIFFLSGAEYHQVPLHPTSSQVEPFVLVIHFVLVANYLQIPTETLDERWNQNKIIFLLPATVGLLDP